MKTYKDFVKEALDVWHPDPKKDTTANRNQPLKLRTTTVTINKRKRLPGESYRAYSERMKKLREKK